METPLPESLRRQALRLAAAMYMGTALAALVALVPGTQPEQINRPVAVLWTIFAIFAAWANWAWPWHRWPTNRRLILSGSGIALLAAMVLATGGSGSPMYSVLLLPASFTAAYYSRREAVAFTAIIVLIAALAVLPARSEHSLRLFFVLAIVVVLAAAFKRLLVEALQRESAEKQALQELAEKRHAHLETTYLSTLAALTAALDAKDRYTEGHGRETATLCLAVGRRLQCSNEELRYLEYGALLHDIGKIGIPGAILSKPGPLTAEEFAMIREHPVIGERILAPVPFLQPVLPLVRHEHERYDGTGYPDGLKGEDIPLGARIIFACDAYDAMSHDRPYRRALPRERVLAELREHAGTQFDPRVVDAVIAVLTEENYLLASQAAGLPWAGDRLTGPGSWAQHLDSIQALGIRLSRINSVKEISNQIGEAIVRLIDHDQCRMWIINNDLLIPIYMSTSRRPEFRDQHARSFRVGEGIVGSVAASRQGLVVGDANRHPKRVRFTSFDESLVAVPVVFGDEVLGVIAVIKVGINQLNTDHLRLLTILANQAAVGIANARMYERLIAEATTDALTGLLNRRAMQERIQRAVAEQTSGFSLLLADINQLKSLNDDYGHHVGDQALVAAADSARAQLGETTILARWGGDEFLGLLPGAAADQAQQRGRNLQAALSRHVLPAAPHLRLALSFGVAHYPTNGKDVATLLIAADRAMYAAKPNRSGDYPRVA